MSPSDRLLILADAALRAMGGAQRAARAMPAPGAPPRPLNADEKQLSGALMRVNHVGEVCAQALYTAQSLATSNPLLRRQFEAAAREEVDHLAWTRARLDALGSRPSLLNPLWYVGAFGIGLVAGRIGDQVSLGFVLETERQVEQHLESHLGRLPAGDTESRAVVSQMKTDEAAHGGAAEAAGARRLPLPVRLAMRLMARVMTTTAHRL